MLDIASVHFDAGLSYGKVCGITARNGNTFVYNYFDIE